VIDFKRLNGQLSPERVAYLLRLAGHRESPYWWRGRCPFHGSNSPRSRSFQIGLVNHLYFCHRCGAKGDLIDLYARFTGVSNYTAAQELAAQFRV
jgi:DNA primase